MSTLILEPGKFEGEPTYVPFFYDLIMEGEPPLFILQQEDFKRFQDLKGKEVLFIFEDGNGFVYSRTFFSRNEFDCWYKNQFGEEY